MFPAPGPINNAVGRVVEAQTDNCGAFPPTASTTVTDEWFSYDAAGHVTDRWQRTIHSGGYAHSSATYYANGELNSLSLPGMSTVTYTLDGDGKQTAAALGGMTLVSNVNYGPVGPLQVYVGSGTDQDSYVYSSTTGKMSNFQFNVGASNASGTLNWNANGTLGSLHVVDGFSATNTQTCAFTYDDVARLIGDNCNPVWAQTFSYDQYDNLKQFGSAYSTSNYDARNRYTLLGTSYDASGNLLSDSVNDFSYDSFGVGSVYM